MIIIKTDDTSIKQNTGRNNVHDQKKVFDKKDSDKQKWNSQSRS